MKKPLTIVALTILVPLTLFSSSLMKKESLTSALHLHNSEIIELEQSIIKGRLETQGAKAQRFGSLTADFSASYFENPPVGPITVNSDELLQQLQLPSQGTNQFITLYEGMESTLYSGQLTYRLPIFTWGKINSSIRLYSALEVAYEAQYEEKLEELSTKISSYTSSLYHLDKIITLLREQQEIAKEIISFAKRSVEVDLITELEYREKQLQLFPIQQALLDIQQQQENIYASLEQLTGIENISSYEIVEDIEISNILSLLEQPLSNIIEQSTNASQNSIQALNAMQSASLEASKIAKGSAYAKPDFALEISARYSGSRLPLIETDWYGQDDYSFTISVGMQSTIFDGKKSLIALQEAQSDIVIARAQKEQAVRTIESEVTKSVHSLSLMVENLSLIQEKIEIMREKTTLLKTKVDLGVTDEITLKAHQIETLQEQIKEQELLLKIKLSYIQLLYLL